MAGPKSPHKLKVLKVSWRERGVLKRVASVARADRNPIIPGGRSPGLSLSPLHSHRSSELPCAIDTKFTIDSKVSLIRPLKFS